MLGGLAALRPRRPALLIAGLAPGVGLVAGGMAGCDGSGGGGKKSGTAERYTMTEVDATDTDTTDGKTYTVDVTIDDAGGYTYKFMFGDGTTTAGGIAGREQTLTVN